MKTLRRAPAIRRRPGSGFTLAELAVTILIVGVTLVTLMQALNGSKMTAAQSRNLKLANNLGLYTLGQIEAGLFQDDYGDRPVGSYAEEGYPDFSFEVIYGDDSFPNSNDASSGRGGFGNGAFNSWEKDDDEYAQYEEDRENEDLPFEKVKVRITFPKLRDFKNELILERWVPWEQVYGPDEDELEAEANQ